MATGKARKRQNSDPNAARVRERILESFSEKAKRSGLRSVVMAELASELRMSATTLYNHFSSKEELVLVERRVMEVAAAEALTSERTELRTPLDRVRHWAEIWSASMLELSVALINLILTRVADPKFADRTGTSRSDAIQTAVSIWASGALTQAGQLRAIPSANEGSDDGPV